MYDEALFGRRCEVPGLVKETAPPYYDLRTHPVFGLRYLMVLMHGKAPGDSGKGTWVSRRSRLSTRKGLNDRRLADWLGAHQSSS
jgi:hypothetical protein